MHDYVITQHLRQRYLERFKKPDKYSHLRTCRGCQKCVDLCFDMRDELRENRQSIDQELLGRLDTAKENRSYLNNTEFMGMIYARYGCDRRFQMLVDHDIVFVVILEGNKKVVPTCLRTNTTVLAGAIRPKFRKKEVQEIA